MKKEISADSTVVVFVCETPTHREGWVPKGTAEKMFSVSPMGAPLPRRELEVVVACFSCSKAAEKAGLQVFPLAITLRKIAERVAARKAHIEETDSYFRSLGAKAESNLLAAREAGRQEALQEQGELSPRGQGRGGKDRQLRGDWRNDLDNARRKGAVRAAREAAAAVRNGEEE